MRDSAHEPVAILETRLVHGVHRVATTLLAEAAVRPAVPQSALKQLRDFLVENLHHHHDSEDHDLWPQITAAAPGAGDAMNELSGEHDLLDSALGRLSAVALSDDDTPGSDDVADQLRKELQDAAVEVRDIVHTHLSHEEPILFPALRDHITPDQWAAFSQRVLATTPMVAGHLMIGFLDQVGTEAEVEIMLSALPEPVQPLIPAMRQQAEQDLLVLHGTVA
ncbi:hemerythrin domain-containing protein [Streptomyces sp. NPDC001414]